MNGSNCGDGITLQLRALHLNESLCYIKLYSSLSSNALLQNN